MPSIFNAANLVREMEQEDFRILQAIELGMRRFEFVPLEQVSFYARTNRSDAQYRLDRLHKMGILQRSSQLGYIGYQLIMESYDILALKALGEKEAILSVGDSIGRGKESDVYFAKTPDGIQVALKIHRIGQNSFRKVRKLRSYVQKRRHISWLYISRLSAESEYKALQKVYPLNLGTPKPIAQNRHIVVMSLIKGDDLSLVPSLEHPIEILNEILARVESYFKEANLIHCDLSEFNILLTPEKKILIIDFPQWEPADHPNAQSYLYRDLVNLEIYFHKKYGITFDIDDFLDRMFGPDRPPIENM